MNGEQLKKGILTQMSRSDGVSLDPYFGLENSFQYAENINADDEMHGLKLAQKLNYSPDVLKDCQLVSTGDHVMSLNMKTGEVRRFDDEDWNTGGEVVNVQTQQGQIVHVVPVEKEGVSYCPGTVFQDFFWCGVEFNVIDETKPVDDPTRVTLQGGLLGYRIAGEGSTHLYVPKDHSTDKDDDIENPDDTFPDTMGIGISAILNYNNARLVVACGTDIWVYYPELDRGPDSGSEASSLSTRGKTGWKKTMHFEEGCTIVGLTCTFEYLKVWVQDEGWNTKVYYYQGNNNLKSTYVYNVIDLTGTKVLRVFSINGIDYYTTSVDGTSSNVMLYKMVGSTPYPLLKQRAGLTVMDTPNKAPYFVGPISIDAGYLAGAWYVSDAYGIWKFTEVNTNNDKYDRGYMKWKRPEKAIPTGLAISKNFIYVTDENGIYRARLYDTGVDGYQEKGILISRELEGEYGGSITKMLEQIRLHFELNPLTNYNGEIDVYVSPNNLWKTTDPKGKGFPDDLNNFYDLAKSGDTWRDRNVNTYDGWFHVMHIDQGNINTRTEEITEFNAMQGGEALQYDRQTLTYAIVIKRYKAPNNPSAIQSESEKATPIVRQVYFKYRIKGKTNNSFDIHN